MKTWLLYSAATLFLAACTEEVTTGATIERVAEANEDVQSLIDYTTDDKFASVIYSETGTSYLLLNAKGTVEATLEEDGKKLNIYLTQKDDGSPDTIEDITFAIELNKAYESIHLFENNQEIPFEIWYE